MTKFIKFSLAIITLLILLNGCQSVEPITLVKPQVQDRVINKCLELQDTEPNEKLGNLNEQFNNVTKSGWYTVEDIDEEEIVFMGLNKWVNEEAILIFLENSSPSGDWIRFDDFCFNGDGGIARLYSDLRTFYGNVQVLRTWEYYNDGSVKNTDIEIIDMNTKEKIDPDSANYLDNPPYMAVSYDDLSEYLELPSKK
jgi:hypothetical protein